MSTCPGTCARHKPWVAGPTSGTRTPWRSALSLAGDSSRPTTFFCTLLAIPRHRRDSPWRHRRRPGGRANTRAPARVLSLCSLFSGCRHNALWCLACDRTSPHLPRCRARPLPGPRCLVLSPWPGSRHPRRPRYLYSTAARALSSLPALLGRRGGATRLTDPWTSQQAVAGCAPFSRCW